MQLESLEEYKNITSENNIKIFEVTGNLNNPEISEEDKTYFNIYLFQKINGKLNLFTYEYDLTVHDEPIFSTFFPLSLLDEEANKQTLLIIEDDFDSGSNPEDMFIYNKIEELIAFNKYPLFFNMIASCFTKEGKE